MRRQTLLDRAGTRSSQASSDPASSPDFSYANNYDALRTRIAASRDDHEELTHLLATAILQAFTADAAGAPTPVGVASWIAEGLARSNQRELLLFATDRS